MLLAPPLLLTLLSPAPAVGAQERAAPADLVLHNGRVVTVEAALPRASAVAVRGGRIVFVGGDAEALALAGPRTRVLDLRQRALYPGFEDAHGHVAGLGAALREVDLVGTRSFAEVVARAAAAAAAAPEGQWVLGRGWDQNDWPDPSFPRHDELSRAIPRRPVALTRVDGHALLANAAAMLAARVERDAADPPGGRILRGPGGAPTGVFVDAAMALVRRAIPPPDRATVRADLLRAIARLHRAGITSVHDAGVGAETLDIYTELARAGELDLRVYIMLDGAPETLLPWLQRGPQPDLDGDGRLCVRAVKLFADGALGSRGAALLQDYADEPGHRGLTLIAPQRLEEVAVQALQAGFQLCTHAIGDGANRLVLDAYERALRRAPAADHRFRVEHAQVLHPDDAPRFARLGVIPSMQAQHAVSDMPWAEQRLGAERVRGAYAWRALLDAGSIIAGGSDFPVEEPDPLAAFRAAVARRGRGAPQGWHPEQCMTREEALRHLTIWPAFAAFAEAETGSIRAGKRADLVAVSEDLLAAPAEALERAAVELTVFDGRVVFEAGAGARGG